MISEKFKNILRNFPVLYTFLQGIKTKVNLFMIKNFGLGYCNRVITNGPIKGLRFIAAKRVNYSKWFWDGTYEQETCTFLKKITTNDAICYDIGANIGYHALVMAEAANNGHVYAFEPIPHVCDILQKNIEINHKKNMTIITKVISNSNGNIQLGLDNSIDQAAIKFAGESESHRMRVIIECEAITLDDFVAQGNPPPSLLKIDVEGAEVIVLQGSLKVLAQYKPIILCETHGHLAAKGVYEILFELGYEQFIVHNGVKPIHSLEEMPNNMDEGHVCARPKKQLVSDF